MQQFEIDLTKAKKIIIQTDDYTTVTQKETADTQHTQQSGGQPQTPPQAQYQQNNGAQHTSNQSKPTYDNNTPMTADQITKALPKLIDGEVNAITSRKAWGWAKNIINNPTLTNAQKAGFLTSIDVRFCTNYLKDFEAQTKNDDYIPFPC